MDPFVSTEWLAQNLASVRVVDIRGAVLPPGAKDRYRPKKDDYEAGHTPGAVFVDWTKDIVDLDDPVPVQVAPPEKIAALMARLRATPPAHTTATTVLATRLKALDWISGSLALTEWDDDAPGDPTA